MLTSPIVVHLHRVLVLDELGIFSLQGKTEEWGSMANHGGSFVCDP